MKDIQMMNQGLFDLILDRIQRTFGKKFEVKNNISDTYIMIANIHSLFPIEATEHELVLNINDELDENADVSVTVYRMHSESESMQFFLKVTVTTDILDEVPYFSFEFEQVQKEIEDTVDGDTCYVYNPVATSKADVLEEKLYENYKWLPNTLTDDELLEEFNNFTSKSTGYLVLQEIEPYCTSFRIIRFEDFKSNKGKWFRSEKIGNKKGTWVFGIINTCGFTCHNNSYFSFTYWKHSLLGTITSNYVIYSISESTYTKLTHSLYDVKEKDAHGTPNAEKDFYNNLLVEFDQYTDDLKADPFGAKKEYFTETDNVISFPVDPEELEFMNKAVVEDSVDNIVAEPSVKIPEGLKDEIDFLMFDTEHIHSLCEDLNAAYEKGVRYFLFENKPKEDNTTKQPTFKLVELRSDYDYTEQGLKIPPFALFVDGTAGETCISVNTHEIVTVVINQREGILDSKHIVILESNNTLTSGAFVKPLTESGYAFYKAAINKYKNAIEELLTVFRIKSRFKLIVDDRLHNPRAKRISEPEAPEDLSVFLKPEDDGK